LTNRRYKLISALAIAGIASSLALMPATASYAAQKDYPVYCSTRSGAHLNSYAAQNVAHYHNGSLVAQWHQGVSTWRRTYHPPVNAILSVWSSWAIYDSSAYCYDNA